MKKKSTSRPADESTLGEKKEFSLISNETLLGLYRNLLKCRWVEERSGAKGNSAKGWEAATVGVAMDLVAEDIICHDDTGLLASFLRVETPATLRSAANGDGSADGFRQLLGAALFEKTRKSGKIAVAFWRQGDSEGWNNALDAARNHSLPAIFVCQTQLLQRRPAPRNGKVLVEEDGLPRIVVDGADVVAVYRVAHEAIERARRDRGPTLIECSRFAVDGQQQRRFDSVANMESYLRSKGLLDRATKAQILEETARELNGAGMRRRNP